MNRLMLLMIPALLFSQMSNTSKLATFTNVPGEIIRHASYDLATIKNPFSKANIKISVLDVNIGERQKGFVTIQEDTLNTILGVYQIAEDDLVEILKSLPVLQEQSENELPGPYGMYSYHLTPDNIKVGYMWLEKPASPYWFIADTSYNRFWFIDVEAFLKALKAAEKRIKELRNS